MIVAPVRTTRIHHVGRLPVPARPVRVPSVRVPLVSFASSKYVCAEPVGLPSALRLCATLIQLLSLWKIFRPAWAYALPAPPTSRVRARARRASPRP